MQRLTLLFTIVCGLIYSNTCAQSQHNPVNKHQVSLGPDFSFLTGRNAKLFNPGIGMSFGYEYLAAKNSRITTNIGYSFLGVKEKFTTVAPVSFHAIPLKIGAKHFFTEKLYGSVELGAIYYKNELYGSNGTAFVYSPSLGIELPLSKKTSVKLGTSYEHWSTEIIATNILALKAAMSVGW